MSSSITSVSVAASSLCGASIVRATGHVARWFYGAAPPGRHSFGQSTPPRSELVGTPSAGITSGGLDISVDRPYARGVCQRQRRLA